MALVWVQSLATGVDWQDKQHKALFDKINGLLEAMKAQKGQDELTATFKFIDRYVRDHFGDEERAMDAKGYPEAVAHKAEHMRFISNFAQVKGQYTEQSANKASLAAQRLLADWFYDHVAKVDKKLGEFLVANR